MYAAGKVGPQGCVSLRSTCRPITVTLPDNARTVRADAFEVTNDDLAAFAPYDVVLSYMAPSTTGSWSTDALRSAALVERAIAVADALAKPGSALVASCSAGSILCRALIRERYATLKTLRPDGVRAHSVEVFLVATGAARDPARDDRPPRGGARLPRPGRTAPADGAVSRGFTPHPP